MQAVYKELSARDKGAAKALRERLDEIKRERHQDELIQEWVQKGDQLRQSNKMSLAQALAWQRDAAKAGAPLSREPLAGIKQALPDQKIRCERFNPFQPLTRTNQHYSEWSRVNLRVGFHSCRLMGAHLDTAPGFRPRSGPT